MRRAVQMVLGLLFVCAMGCAESGATPAAPSVEPGTLFRPTFETVEGRFSAGTAFAVRLEAAGPALLVTALHLFGEAGGLEREIPPGELPRFCRGLALEGIPDGSVVRPRARALAIPGSAPLGQASRAGDVAVFLFEDVPASLKILEVGQKAPGPGERVWLAAEVVGTPPAKGLLHPATVEGVEEGMLVYRYDRTLDLTATSGAPVLDARGRVVGINLGGLDQDGSTYGLGNPVERFVPAVRKALASRPQA